jgi:hypothetical protein
VVIKDTASAARRAWVQFAPLLLRSRVIVGKLRSLLNLTFHNRKMQIINPPVFWGWRRVIETTHVDVWHRGRAEKVPDFHLHPTAEDAEAWSG